MRKLFICFVLLICFLDIKATHIMGGEITWECIKDPNDPDVGKYIFKMKVYRDCDGIGAPNSLSLNYSSSSCGVNSSMAMYYYSGYSGLESSNSYSDNSRFCFKY